MHLQAIIFDFDGVIADTERLHLRAFREVLAGQGVELTEADYYARYLGFNDTDVLRSVARDCGLAPDDARLAAMLRDKAARYARLIATSPVLYEGVERQVREWSRQVPLAIASGAIRSEIDGILGRSNLAACFAAIITARDVAHGKPAPDPYLAALAALNRGVSGKAEALPYRRKDVPPSDAGRRTPDTGRQSGPTDTGHRAPAIAPAGCVVIEDSPPGIEAAKAAGMRTVAVTTNHPARLLAGADLVAASVAALDLAMLDRLV
jgi:beta-phosphoglucomutase-like phosphatase (HAD superfamily)